MASFVYTSLVRDEGKGLVNFDTATLKVMLLKRSHTPLKNTHENVSDISSDEISGSDATGYDAGGKELTGVTFVKDGTNSRAVLDANNPSWNPSSITAGYAVVYISTGNPATSKLVGLFDFGAAKSSSSDRFQINFNDSGMVQWTC